MGMAPLASVLSEELFWVIVGVAVAVVIGVITIWITVRGRPRRALTYEAQATAVVAEEAAGRLTIAFDGRPVQDVHLVDLTVANTGNSALRAEDFVRPLHVVLPPGANALSAEVTGTDPPDLGPQVSIVPDTGATISPLLLNPRDGLTLSVLVADFPPGGDVALGGRVAGVSQLDRSIESTAGMLADAARVAFSIAGVTVTAGPTGIEATTTLFHRLRRRAG
jgi:hypothetical protein